MPFGLSSAPSSFQRLMDTTLQGLPFVTIYLDDILVHSENEETHKEHLAVVFKHLLDAGFTLRGAKCHIGMSTMQYLGHVFSAVGMSPDPKRWLTGQPQPIPQKCASFWDWHIVLQEIIQHFSEVVAPLYSLTQGDVAFTWNEDSVFSNTR